MIINMLGLSWFHWFSFVWFSLVWVCWVWFGLVGFSVDIVIFF